MIEKLNCLHLSHPNERARQWVLATEQSLPVPVTLSVDVRHSPFKLSVVDTNIFPAGFGKLCARSRTAGSSALRSWLRSRHPRATLVGILGEHHTRNPHYLESLLLLADMVAAAGVEVRVALLPPAGKPAPAEPGELEAAGGRKFLPCSLARDRDSLRFSGETPGLVLLNSDLSAGVPAILEGLGQPVEPLPGLGWHRRRKSLHFRLLWTALEQYCALTGEDPWTLGTFSDVADHVDFMDPGTLGPVADKVEALLDRIADKYREHGVSARPYVFVKNDAGTYGMACMHVERSSEVRDMNRRARDSMQRGKDSVPVQSVLLQEGVPTCLQVHGHPCEPVMALVAGEVVGGFLRANDSKDQFGNLNSRGMQFHRYCFTDLASEPPEDCSCAPESFAPYPVIARLAAIAAGMEARACLDQQPHNQSTEQQP